MADPPDAPADTVVAQAPTGADDFLAQERDSVDNQSTWQPYDHSVADFEVMPETLTEFGELLTTDADEFQAGFDHALGQAMSGLPNFGMSTDGVLADGAELTTAYYPAFQSLVKLMGEVWGGLNTLGAWGRILGFAYDFGDGESAEMLEATRHFFGETRLWGDDPNRPYDLDEIQEQAEANFDEIRQNPGAADIDVTVVEVNDEGGVETRTETASTSGDEAAVGATDRTHNEINDLVDQQQGQNELFPAGDWDREGAGLEPDPLNPERPPEGHPVEAAQEGEERTR